MKSKKQNRKPIDIVKDDNSIRIIPQLPLSLEYARDYDAFIKSCQNFDKSIPIILELSSATEYDSYLILFINSLKQICRTGGSNLEIYGMTKKTENFLKRFSFPEYREAENKEKGFFTASLVRIGEETKTVFRDTKDFISFFGDLLAKLLVLFVHPKKMRWKDFPFHFTRAGVNAVFICLLILLLLGLITGYQGALQLKQFGADKYIADLVGISIVRELSPLMVAILVAGRSGSAFAAELGTMKVSDEIDALTSMGFDYVQFLVLPRVLSVTFAIPILTLLADAAGIAGGCIAALTTLNITFSGFINELSKALEFSDIFSGIGKSIIFGFLIAAVGCFRGLQVHGGAESVGKYTTISVVTGILMIIFADSIFTFLFHALGI